MLLVELLPGKRLAANCAASLCWAFSFGLGAPLASLWLQEAGHGATIIGLNTGVYYLGIALAAGLVPWMIRRWGRGCAVLGMLGSGLTLLAFPWGGGLFGWFVLRLLNGVTGAMSLIPLETHVNQNAGPGQRARDFGYYAFSIGLGIALGTLVGLQIYTSDRQLAFLVGAAPPLLSAFIAFQWLDWPEYVEEKASDEVPLTLSQTFLSFGSAWSQGFLEGGMIALLPVYLLGIGLTESDVSWLMSGIMLGVIAFQVPVAWLADRWGCTAILSICYGVTALALIAAPYCLNLPTLAVSLFFAGACSGAFYPLGLALLGERVPKAGLAKANAWYLGINCVGSLIGPAASGIAMDSFGRDALFGAGLIAVVLVFVGSLVLKIATARMGEIQPTAHIEPAAASRAA